MPAITGIDHLLIDVEDLEGARATWHRLGFTMTPRGLHPQWGTGNYCMMFPDSYLELIGIADPQVYAQNEARRGRRRTGTGLSAIALATGDAQAAKTALLVRLMLWRRDMFSNEKSNEASNLLCLSTSADRRRPYADDCHGIVIAPPRHQNSQRIREHHPTEQHSLLYSGSEHFSVY